MSIGRFKTRPAVKLTQQQKSLKAPYARIRREGGFLELSAVRTNHHGVTHPSDYVTEETWTTKIGTSRVMSDIVTPGYLYRLRRGDILNNPSWMVEESYKPSLGSWSKVGTAVGATDCTVVTNGYIGAGFENYPTAKMAPEKLTSSVNLQRLIDLAAIQAYSRVEEPKTLSLVTAAELGKTLDLVATRAKLIAGTLRLIKLGRPIEAAYKLFGRRFKSAPVAGAIVGPARTWLEWRYGWGPTVMDINGTLQAIASGSFTTPRKRVFGRSSGSSQDQYPVNEDFVPFGLANHGSYRVAFRTTDEISVKSYILYEADLRMSAARAFGVTDLGSTAWELIPGSFLVDWIIPIGDWIQALEPRIDVKILAYGYTVDRQQSLIRDVVSFTRPNTGDGHDYIEDLTFVGHFDRYDRRQVYRVPTLSVPTLPPVDVKLNAKRVADAISLLVANARSLRF